jgi:hypothetical protein
MKTLLNITLTTILLGMGTAYAAEDCQSLQEQKNLIYSAHGYCFNDPAAQKEHGADCYTKKPKFSDAEKKRLAQIEEKQKALNCPKKD